MSFPRVLALLGALACRESDDAQLPDGGSRQDTGPASDATAQDEVGRQELEHPARVVDHIDGDTMDVRFRDAGTRVRLLGIDTPETYPEEEPFGAEAKEFVRQAAPDGDDVGLEFDEHGCASANAADDCFDTYERLLAYVRLRDGHDLGAELLVRGLAEVHEHWPGSFDRVDEYRALEQQARTERVGIWSE